MIDNKLRESMGIVLLASITRVLEWNRAGRVTWRHITENEETEISLLEDFEKAIKALSDPINDFKGKFTIKLNNGTAIVEWHI